MTVSGQVPEQAHAQLAKATAGFFENGSLPMWIYDLSTLAFLAVNGAAAECYGYTHEEFLAMTARQLHLRAERTASLDAAFVAYLRATEPGGITPVNRPDIEVIAEADNPNRHRFSKRAVAPE